MTSSENSVGPSHLWTAQPAPVGRAPYRDTTDTLQLSKDKNTTKASLDSYVFDRPASLAPILDTIFSFESHHASVLFPRLPSTTGPRLSTATLSDPRLSSRASGLSVDDESRSMLAYLDSLPQDDSISKHAAVVEEPCPSSASFNVFDCHTDTPRKASPIPTRDSSGSLSDSSADWFAPKESDESHYDTASNFSFGMAGDILLGLLQKDSETRKCRRDATHLRGVIHVNIPLILEPTITSVLHPSTTMEPDHIPSIPSMQSATMAELIAAANVDEEECIMNVDAPAQHLNTRTSFDSEHQIRDGGRNLLDGSPISQTVSQLLCGTNDRLLNLETPNLSASESFASLPISGSPPEIMVDSLDTGDIDAHSLLVNVSLNSVNAFITSCLPSIDDLDEVGRCGVSGPSELSTKVQDAVRRAHSAASLRGPRDPEELPYDAAAETPARTPESTLQHPQSPRLHPLLTACAQDLVRSGNPSPTASSPVSSSSEYSSFGAEVEQKYLVDTHSPLLVSAAVARELRSLDGGSRFRWIGGQFIHARQIPLSMEDFTIEEKEGKKAGWDETSLVEATKVLSEPTNFSFGQGGDILLQFEAELDVTEPDMSGDSVDIDTSPLQDTFTGCAMRGSGSLWTIKEEDSCDFDYSD